ncbi:hypothetical protein VTN00DRAFT_1485 [Thermoascus crustaceus]|uniref:uncharacterized protein n=1 Tax=Thermoascus crustaceus TaxID=5088 RepID=UPI00374398D6
MQSWQENRQAPRGDDMRGENYFCLAGPSILDSQVASAGEIPDASRRSRSPSLAPGQTASSIAGCPRRSPIRVGIQECLNARNTLPASLSLPGVAWIDLTISTTDFARCLDRNSPSIPSSASGSQKSLRPATEKNLRCYAPPVLGSRRSFASGVSPFDLRRLAFLHAFIATIIIAVVPAPDAELNTDNTSVAF